MTKTEKENQNLLSINRVHIPWLYRRWFNQGNNLLGDSSTP